MHMPSVSGYDQDIFISYAHVDDEPFDAAGPDRSLGWVATLVRHLENYLAREIGRKEGFALWKDKYNLHGNDPLAAEIATKLQRTGVFVAILSPGYLASTWCRDEAHLFTEHFAGEVSSRVFVVERAPLADDAAVPQRLTGRRNSRFWYLDDDKKPRTFAKPMSEQNQIQYFRQVEDLARDIHRQLKRMAASPRAPTQGSAVTSVIGNGPNGSAVVLLAEVTDDLELRRDGVRRYLEQQGALVLPQATYPLGRAQFEAALDADLARSRLFVQLLGPEPGKRPPDVPEGYNWLQLHGARRHGMRVLQWRNSELDLAGIEWPPHRELLQLETVQATSLETFKGAVVAALAPPPSPTPTRATGGQPLVFLNTELRHSEIAAKIRDVIRDRAALVEPLREGPAEEVRVDFEQNLIDCDAMVMVYTDNAGWARAQLRAFRKQAPQRERPVRAIPVIDAPAQPKPELGFYMPEMIIIDSRAGIGPEALAQLSEALRL
jgi:TIR domain